jgi:uncharacterized protein YegJ (DUF2314 family)
MIKLISQLIVAAAVWMGLRSLDVGAGWRVVAVLGGFAIVHLVWERLFFNPYLHLGAMPFASDDPLMVAAMAKGRETLPAFLKLYPEHSDDSVVRFRFVTSKGEIEWLWGDLLSVEGDDARVYVRTPPVDHDGELERTMTVPLSDVTDWQIEFRDGTLRGGFTNRAMFKIFERQEGHMPAQFLEQLQRFKELE